MLSLYSSAKCFAYIPLQLNNGGWLSFTYNNAGLQPLLAFGFILQTVIDKRLARNPVSS